MTCTASKARRLFGFALVFLAVAGGSSIAFADDLTVTDCLRANETASKLQTDKRLREAREQAAICAAEACPVELHDTCRQRVADLNKSIPTLVFHAKDANGADITAVKVTMDGHTLVDHLDGTAIAVDPGRHTFRFEAVGQPPIERTWLVQEGEKDRAESVVIGEASPSVAPVPPREATPAPASEPMAAPSPPAEPPSDGHAQRAVGLVIGGAGVAGLLVGGIFGALSMSAHSDYEKSCGSNIGAPPNACNQTGVNGESDAATKGTISTIGFIAGGALVAGGAVLFFTAPTGVASVQLGFGPAFVSASGQF